MTKKFKLLKQYNKIIFYNYIYYLQSLNNIFLLFYINIRFF